MYGNTSSDGTLGNGVMYKVTTGGSYTALHNFANTGDGVNRVNAFVIGNFYGLTVSNPETFNYLPATDGSLVGVLTLVAGASRTRSFLIPKVL